MPEDFLKLIYPQRYKEKEPEPPKPKSEIPKEISPTGRVGYWASHDYKRRSTMSIRYFCGWEKLLNLLNKCETLIIRGLIATLFETGGRASEVLSLTKEQFVDKENYILITGMLVLKQTKEENKFRQVPMLKSDKLVQSMVDWVDEVEEGRLFPYKYDWLYKKVREVDPDWWPHRFRAERASQLAIEKNLSVPELMKWFGWSSEEMPTHYVRMSVVDLVEKMSRGEL